MLDSADAVTNESSADAVAYESTVTAHRLATAIGCANNPKNIRSMLKRRRESSFKDIIENECLLPPRKTRKDKMSDDPVFTSMWHQVWPVSQRTG